MSYTSYNFKKLVHFAPHTTTSFSINTLHPNLLNQLIVPLTISQFTPVSLRAACHQKRWLATQVISISREQWLFHAIVILSLENETLRERTALLSSTLFRKSMHLNVVSSGKRKGHVTKHSKFRQTVQHLPQYIEFFVRESQQFISKGWKSISWKNDT